MSLQPFADDIRKDLLETLSRPDIDYDRLVKLTSEMAKQDPNNVRFAVDAGIISRLGRELVAKQETAVAELVKNAYDADATKVELVFSNTDFPGGSLTVTDNGTGMDRQELVDGFMRLSSTTKVREPVSRVYKRIRAGRKGIGRFAAQRLGNQLTIITQTLDADKALKVEIDWSQFQPDRDLATVSNSLAEADKKQAQGTQLVIQGLHERWTTASIERVFRYVSDLLQPYPLSTRGQWISGSEAHFEPVLYRNENGVLQEVANLSTEIYDLAIAVFEGVVDNEGHALWSVKSNKLNIDETEQLGKSRDDSSSPYNHLRNVSLKAYYFLLKPAPLLIVNAESRSQRLLVAAWWYQDIPKWISGSPIR
jgi:HSP90 family molecular chaperone